jgi:hypothetical protein
MSNKKSNNEKLFQNLDEILAGMIWYVTLLDGRHVKIRINIGSNGYSGKGFVELWKIYNYGPQEIYSSKHDYYDNKYTIRIYTNIREVKKNIKEIKKLTKDIERLAIETLKNYYNNDNNYYPEILIDFEAKIQDPYEILAEFNETEIVFEQPESKEYESEKQSIIKYEALVKRNKNSSKIELIYPKSFRFSFIVYDRSNLWLN